MSEVCIRVAVRIRPLLPKEVLHHHQVCARVVPGSTQVMLGSDRVFSFDHAFGPTASQDEVYESCVQPLVESLIDGYNATVFCYGQTGSGKTYTLGGGNQDEEGGIIDRVAHDVFMLLGDKMKNNDSMETMVRVSYVEVYKEELRDLLELHTIHKELHIREDERGNTVVVGAKEMAVTSAEELLSVLEIGNALRHTAATGMNEHSSRSHAILTLQVNICCHSNSNSFSKSSKLCLVDLAGSERAGKTADTGTQLKECAHINTGLLALSNVIRALSDIARNRHGNSSSRVHVPYRDAKITRLLRESLGGTAHTLMVACVSPSHHFVAETLNVLRFASKARQIRNSPGRVSVQTDVKSCLTTWHPSEARLGELEYEVQTLRELLKDRMKDMEMEREKTGGSDREGEHLKQSSQVRIFEPDQKVSQQEVWQYCVLVQEAAALLADISGPSPSLSFKQQLEDWQERLEAVSQSHQTDDIGCSEGHRDQPLKLREELYKCQETLRIKEQLLEQKDAELRQVQAEVEKLLQERRTHLTALEEEKKHTQIQTEQLVNQQILIDRLRSNFISFRETTSRATAEAEASGDFGKRPHSVPLIANSCVRRPTRKIHSSPPMYSLERIMAAFKLRGHLLLAEIEENDDVYCPFTKQEAESKDRGQENKEEMNSFMDRTGLRSSLNRTWTCRQRKLAFKEQSSGLNDTCNGNPIVQQPQQTTDAMESQHKLNQMRKARRASATERRIHGLSVNMRMKEELIKELDKTEKETHAVNRHSRCSSDSGEAGVLVRLSMQSQQVRTEVYHSLQHMKQQKVELQNSLRQQRETDDSNKNLHHSGGQSAGYSAVCRDFLQEESNTGLHASSWLEKEEEKVLQKRAELQWLKEELKKREELLLSREAYLQQKNKLEIKMLHTSQTVNQELLHVSMQLKSVEEKLQNFRNVRETGGVTIEEMEKKRDMLKMRRDTLNVQLRNNRALTEEEEHFLLQLEETIEALDAALEFKNHSIQDKKKQFLVTETSLDQSQSTEPAQLCDVIRRLKELQLPEALELLVKYFNKVVCLREAERCLRLRCEELELHVEEQEAVLKEMEASIQLLALYADRRLTQQHRDHQNDIQLLLQDIKEDVSGETQQVKQGRLQHLEKELFFYKSSTRQLKKKLKELLSDAIHPDNQPSKTQEQRQMHNVQMEGCANDSQPNSVDAPTRTHITTTYTKIYSKQTDTMSHRDSRTDRLSHQTQCPSLSSEYQVQKKTKMSGCKQILTQAHGSGVRGQSGESLEMTPVQLCRRELRQISLVDLQVSGSATRRLQSVDTTTESVIEDSIEVSKNNDM
ncbi:kinesin-like protein KIF27 [Melanotaenia boesemani]|uniref:kinesin-like protein KIF27 n=1 Tax=Melanotaenia boesemani TaxID=1250792 RepID=UPI001C04C663|nr:kinesin-like protein KIF27 [Melanotaenia boesemani]XP_041855052.1 kinesin-like protein KIF27 [Melanotaenia boesemani]